jgi:hypothetical protein
VRVERLAKHIAAQLTSSAEKLGHLWRFCAINIVATPAFSAAVYYSPLRLIQSAAEKQA